MERDAGRLARALELIEGALRACAAQDDRHREAALENLADLHHAAGRPDEAMAHLRRAVAGFAEVAPTTPPGSPRSWKLVSW